MNMYGLFLVLLGSYFCCSSCFVWPFVNINNTEETAKGFNASFPGDEPLNPTEESNTTSDSWWRQSWNFVTSPFTTFGTGVSNTFNRMYLHSGAKYLAKLLSTYSGPGGNGTLPELDDSVIWWRRKYFRRLSSNDIQHCMSLLVCEACANPGQFGFVGDRAVAFFEAFRPSEEYGPSAAWFASVARQGLRTQTPDLCRSLFPDCPRNASYWTKTVTHKLLYRYSVLNQLDTSTV